MRKIVLSIAAAGAALATASPAAAQYYPQPQPAPYGYNNGYNGYNNGFRGLTLFGRRPGEPDRPADRLRDEANRIENRLHRAARGGLDPREAGDLQYRIQRLEQRVQYSIANNYGRRGDRDDRWGHRDDD